MKSKILIVGSSGLLGSEFLNLLNLKNVYAPSSQEMNVTQYNTVESYCSNKKDIAYIINCAASRNAEFLENNSKFAYDINVKGVENLAKISNLIDATLIHFSTDYIFDGKKSKPYVENDLPNPLSV